ncbi:hypothetical protein HYH03_012250 [Edaphochlamys debaryana]|uniref:Integrase catalytic domain-containing protein n=1 Tax=Edaphochlamys debaryana TaxID=47281 RepID=A0A835XS63_9CHLO|nr:hypothetical protein HYH03_012250 [Edaphochlamys debaryana]|eukprot:KAG2489228.1 hypothetical protein HYH03_012250 [Edaphochlamys debaryana]
MTRKGPRGQGGAARANRQPATAKARAAYPSRPWGHVAVHLVSDLPPSRPPGRQMDFTSAVIFFDLFSRMVFIEAIPQGMDPEALANAFMSKVFALRGMPDCVVCGPDPRLASEWWLGVWPRMGAGVEAYGGGLFQADCASDLEQVVREYLVPLGDQWAERLVMAEMAYNGSLHPLIGYSPFYAVNCYDPGFRPAPDLALPFNPPPPAPLLSNDQRLQRMEQVMAEIKGKHAAAYAARQAAATSSSTAASAVGGGAAATADSKGVEVTPLVPA